MKIMRSICVTVLIICCLLALSACTNELYTVEITETGGSVESAFLLPKEDFQENPEVLESEEFQEAAEAGWEFSYCTVDGKEYAKISITRSFDSLEQLSEKLNWLWVYNEAVPEEPPVASYLSNVCVARDEKGHSLTVTGSIPPMTPLEKVECVKLIVKFPGTVTEYNIGTKVNDTTLEIDLLEVWASDADVSFCIKARLPGAYSWLYALLGLCILLAAGGGFVVYKKRSAASRDAAGEPSAEAQETAEAAAVQEAEAAAIQEAEAAPAEEAAAAQIQDKESDAC